LSIIMASYHWSESAGRYTDARGRYVAERIVRGAVDAVADHASDRIAAACLRLLAGEQSLASWQAEVQGIVKLAHVATGVLAHGGRAQMAAADYGALGPIIRAEYNFLRQFAQQINGELPANSGRENGEKQALNGSLVARARQYGQASRVTYERIRQREQRRRGYASERNVLHAGESCSQCRSETARGRVPIGSLVLVGGRICRSQCRCRLVYSREAVEVAA
jgi:hypothetical protein